MLRALFTGTFDPPTYGHLNLIKRASAIFEELVVGIGENSDKPAPILTVSERIEAIKKETSFLPNVKVISFSGLTCHFAKETKADVLIRGLRLAGDFESEGQMAMANQQIGGMETLFLMSKDPYISSTLIRELAACGAPIEKFVPQHLVPTFQHRLQKGK